MAAPITITIVIPTTIDIVPTATNVSGRVAVHKGACCDIYVICKFKSSYNPKLYLGQLSLGSRSSRSPKASLQKIAPAGPARPL